MDNELLKLIGGSGLGAIIIATLYGLGQLITSWRGGNASQERIEMLEKRIEQVERRNSWLEKLLPVVRYQRDQARLRAEALAEKQGVTLAPWGEEPQEGT